MPPSNTLMLVPWFFARLPFGVFCHVCDGDV